MSNHELIEKLVKEPLFSEIKKDVFLAFRENRIDLYHKGGKLFSYDNNEFSTHIKYASVIDASDDDSPKNYVTEKELENYKLESHFSKGIKRIKENCENYAGEEAKGVAEIYHKYSYLSDENIVVLDIEITFEAEEREGFDRKVRDRVDILLLDKENKKLFFVEAKHFSNGALWSKTTPKVIGQIEKYEQHIKNEKKNLLNKYYENIELLNKLFKIELPKPKDIDENVVLLVFGFDNDQKYGRLTDLILNKEEYKGKKVCYVGKAKGITPEHIISTKVQK